MSLILSPLPKSQYVNKVNKKQQQNKKSSNKISCSSRMLITVNVKGSSGPIKLVVNKEESAEAVIRSVLKVYAREGRLPVIGRDCREFYLYHASVGEALKSSEAIGSSGSRNFLMCKRSPLDQLSDNNNRRGNWKSWLNKSLNFTISSH